MRRRIGAVLAASVFTVTGCSTAGEGSAETLAPIPSLDFRLATTTTATSSLGVGEPAIDLLGASAFLEHAGVASFRERSEATVTVGDEERYRHVIDVGLRRDPAAFQAQLAFPVGGANRSDAVESGSLSAEGRIDLVAVDGVLYQNIGGSWDASSFVGVAFGTGRSVLAALTDAMALAPVESVVVSGQTQLGDREVTELRSEDPLLVALVWDAVASSTGTMAPSVPVTGVTSGTAVVFVDEGGLVLGAQYSFVGVYGGEEARFAGGVEGYDFGADFVVQAPT